MIICTSVKAKNIEAAVFINPSNKMNASATPP
jgi:hypothetical protein